MDMILERSIYNNNVRDVEWEATSSISSDLTYNNRTSRSQLRTKSNKHENQRVYSVKKVPTHSKKNRLKSEIKEALNSSSVNDFYQSPHHHQKAFPKVNPDLQKNELCSIQVDKSLKTPYKSKTPKNNKFFINHSSYGSNCMSTQGTSNLTSGQTDDFLTSKKHNMYSNMHPVSASFIMYFHSFTVIARNSLSLPITTQLQTWPPTSDLPQSKSQLVIVQSGETCIW